MGNAIADFKNRTYFIDIEVYFVVFNLFLMTDVISSELIFIS